MKKHIFKRCIKYLLYTLPTDWMPDSVYLRLNYYINIGKKPNIAHPQTFNEKMQWLKMNNRKNEYTLMVDKYAVRKYISEQLGEEYLIPLLGVWNEPDEIDFDTLPNQFVLKCNHNSGLGMCICKDKSKLDVAKVKAELKKGLAQDYYSENREWPYKDVPRKIIAEKYMVDEDSPELKDYKIWCFNGVPRMTLVCSERFSGSGLHEDFYDMEWKHLDVKRVNSPLSEKKIECPHNYILMQKFAAKLSKDIPFARIDFYEISGKVYFGEITFFPASGFERFEPDDWDLKLGKWIEL